MACCVRIGHIGASRGRGGMRLGSVFVSARINIAVLTITLAVMAALFAAGARAQDAGPGWRARLNGAADISMDGNIILTPRPGKSGADLYGGIDPTLKVPLMADLNLVWETALESVTGLEAGAARLFGARGLYSQKLYLSFRHDVGRIGTAKLAGRVFAGKFTPAFGRAWEDGLDIYGSDFDEGYEFVERVGFGAEPVIEGGIFGRQVFQATVFFRDTSALSKSWMTPRDRRRLSDGGVSNTGRLNSFTFSWTAIRLPPFPGLEMQAGVAYQSPGSDGTVPEIGVVGSVLYSRKLGDVTLKPFLELVRFAGADGVEGRTRLYMTAAMSARWQGWNASVAALLRRTHNHGVLDDHDLILSASTAYNFEHGLGLTLAFRYAQDLQAHRTVGHGAGVLATVVCKFSMKGGAFPFGCFGD